MRARRIALFTVPAVIAALVTLWLLHAQPAPSPAELNPPPLTWGGSAAAALLFLFSVGLALFLRAPRRHRVPAS